MEKSSSGERAKIIPENGEALEERIRMISQAKEEIILSTYDIKADISGKQVLAALLDAADRGVKVSIVTDWGSLCDFHLGKSLFSCNLQDRKM